MRYQILILLKTFEFEPKRNIINCTTIEINLFNSVDFSIMADLGDKYYRKKGAEMYFSKQN